MCVCVYVYMYVCICVCVYVYIYICIHVFIYLFLYLRMLHFCAVILHGLNVHIIEHLSYYRECCEQPQVCWRRPLHVLYDGIYFTIE